MFGNNLLNRLSDAVPADLKEKVIEVVKEELSGNAPDWKIAIERLGLVKTRAQAGSSVASADTAEAVAGSDDATAEFVVEQPEAAENI